jgi:hypothetical protein
MASGDPQRLSIVRVSRFLALGTGLSRAARLISIRFSRSNVAVFGGSNVNRRRLSHVVAGALAVAIGTSVALPTYGVVRSWLLVQEGWKVVANPSLVSVSMVSSPVGEHVSSSDSSAEIELHNIAQHSVRVVGAQTSCGCISPIDQFPFVLHPHEQKRVSFRLQIDAAAKDGDALGTVTFFLDEPTPTITVSFRADLPKSD